MTAACRFAVAAPALLIALVAGDVSAQRLVPPDEIVIYVHKEMENTDFVEGLVCELGRVLVPPVRATTTDFPLLPRYLATRTQFDVEKILPPFARATASSERIFRYLYVPYDLKATGLNYVFANTDIEGDTVAVMSPIRLIPREPGLSRKRVSDVTGDRLYRMMLKSVALLSGLRSDGCVMTFPRSLDELDLKPAEFCSAAKAALIAAGVLKEKPFGACSTVAMASP
jgi:predicted Zn-dependent protease